MNLGPFGFLIGGPRNLGADGGPYMSGFAGCSGCLSRGSGSGQLMLRPIRASFEEQGLVGGKLSERLLELVDRLPGGSGLFHRPQHQADLPVERQAFLLDDREHVRRPCLRPVAGAFPVAELVQVDEQPGEGGVADLGAKLLRAQTPVKLLLGKLDVLVQQVLGLDER